MSYAAQLQAERKARLARLGDGPRIKAARELKQVIELQNGIIEGAGETVDVPYVVTDWVKRQRAIFKELLSVVSPDDDALVDMGTIIRVTSTYYGISRNDILSDRRTARLARARQVAYFLCKNLSRRSFPEIGRKFGGRDHTTIIHGVRKIEREVRHDTALAYDVAQIKKSLR
jgi:chromosomal replication initiation ATPase DnaA